MFNIRLIDLRKSKDLTQQVLADLLHMSRATYAQYEIGRRQPDYDTLVKIADYFNVSLDYLLGRTDEKTPESKTIFTGKELFDKVPQKYHDLINNESTLKFFDKMKQEDITPELMTELFESIIKIRKSMNTKD